MGGSYRPINSAMGQGQVFGEAGESFGDADRRAKQPLAPEDAKTSYGATLARNACHFAPESWHAWADLHNQAVVKAKAAATKKLEALALRGQADAAANPDDKARHQQAAQAAETAATGLANEALLINGFGDHYLQDSYASGHLINKTKIMQWYVQFIDQASWFKEKTLHSAEAWRKRQDMAYAQPGISADAQYDKNRAAVGVRQVRGQAVTTATNPQTVENIHIGAAGQQEPADAWRVRFEALGLRLPAGVQNPQSPAFRVLLWWQEHVASRGKQEYSYKNLKKALQDGTHQSISDPELLSGLHSLIDDGVVRAQGIFLTASEERTTKSRGSATTSDTFALRDEWVPRNVDQFRAIASGLRDDPQNAARVDQYQSKASEVVYGEYIAFMKDAMVQKASNAMHDVFCKSGLYVSSAQNEAVFKIYGDDAMLQAESAKGLLHSATTARMSSEAIRDTFINFGNNPQVSTQDILNRLPAFVSVPTVNDKGDVMEVGPPTPPISLADFHRDDVLGALCKEKLFPNKIPSYQKGLASKKELSLAVSKDEPAIHAGQPF